MIEKTVVIMRAWPGCGKSTLANAIVQNLTNGTVGVDCHSIQAVRICSADRYHVNPRTGRYTWHPNRVAGAHIYCTDSFAQAIGLGHTLIIVDNTNIKRAHYDWYVDAAKRAGYKVYQAIPETPWMHSVDECFKRNVHNVPLETIQRMKAEFEDDDELEHFKLPDKWKDRLPTLATLGASG